jgi:hypothetical protein
MPSLRFQMRLRLGSMGILALGHIVLLATLLLSVKAWSYPCPENLGDKDGAALWERLRQIEGRYDNALSGCPLIEVLVCDPHSRLGAARSLFAHPVGKCGNTSSED